MFGRGSLEDEDVRLRALGAARGFLYAVAAGTGLRRGELRRVRWQDVDVKRRVVAIPAKSAKSRRDQEVPLRADLVKALEAHKPSKAKEHDPVFPSASFPTHRTFAADLLAAKIARVEREETTPPGTPENDRKFREWIETDDGSGRTVDFHCLRVTFVSSLAAAGVHPRVAQALARHSSVELTMRAYTDVTLLDLRGAVEKTAPGDLACSLACTGAVETTSASSTFASEGSDSRNEETSQDVENARQSAGSRKAADGGRRGTRTPDLVRVKHAL